MTPSRYESLDVWRGAACLLVVVFHSAGYLAGEGFDSGVRAAGGSAFDWVLVAVGRFWVGVPLFFVVSGYCISAAADTTRAKPGGVGRYFVRRLRRIYPPLWAAVALAVLAWLALPAAWRPGPTPEGVVAFDSPANFAPWQWFGNLTLTESWRAEVVGPERKYVLGQLWTLCYEEQFYLVVGLTLLVARRWFFPAMWLVTALVLLNLADLNGLVGNRLGVDLNAYQVRVKGLFTDGLWLGFAAGVAVYYRVNHATPVIGAAIEFVLVALAVSAAAAPDVADTRQTLAKYNLAGCAFAVLLCRLHRFDVRLAKTRWTAPLRFCGRMCYSLYLTHTIAVLPVAWCLYRAGLTSPAATVLVTIPVCTALAVGLGYAFYRLVERRFLNTSPRPKPAPAPPSAP